MDPFGIFDTLTEVAHAWEEHPCELAHRHRELLLKLQEATLEEMRQHLGPGGEDAEARTPGFFDALRSGAQLARRHHAICQEWLREMVVRAPGLEGKKRERMLFWTKQFLNATSPANFFWTNYPAVQRFMESNGESLSRGLQSWTDDLLKGHLLMRMVDDRAFKVGDNIATTPGAVVFRNDLMELIQYEPSTPTTYPVPVVFIQPWINKYYIFDLTAPMSFVRHMRDRGFTVFIISWKNPDSRMRHVTFEDYMLRGAERAIDVARSICRSPQVHAAGYCIGGTALSALMAWLNRGRSGSAASPVADWTTFSSLVDFSEPGEMGFFLTRRSVEAIEELMKASGFLSKQFIQLGFRLLGSDSLIWRNFVNGCLYGMAPPKSDVLFWNSDSTRLPEAMCSFYLREFYLNNRLVQKDALRLGNRPIDLGRIRQPLYAVGTQLDHICPWKSTFRICDKVQGPVRYVLSSEGHITGIVNPPSELSRRKFWAGEAGGERNADAWLARQEETRGSWWEDWTEWLLARSHTPAAPPPMGSRKYPVLAKAPGRYVMEA